MDLDYPFPFSREFSSVLSAPELANAWRLIADFNSARSVSFRSGTQTWIARRVEPGYAGDSEVVTEKIAPHFIPLVPEDAISRYRLMCTFLDGHDDLAKWLRIYAQRDALMDPMLAYLLVIRRKDEIAHGPDPKAGKLRDLVDLLAADHDGFRSRDNAPKMSGRRVVVTVDDNESLDEYRENLLDEIADALYECLSYLDPDFDQPHEWPDDDDDQPHT